MMVCSDLFRTQPRFRSVHRRHGGPRSSMMHFIWGKLSASSPSYCETRRRMTNLLFTARRTSLDFARNLRHSRRGLLRVAILLTLGPLPVVLKYRVRAFRLQVMIRSVCACSVSLLSRRSVIAIRMWRRGIFVIDRLTPSDHVRFTMVI